MISLGWRSPEMLKWCRERWVWAPQSRSTGTAISPRLSCSILMVMVPPAGRKRGRGKIPCPSQHGKSRGRTLRSPRSSWPPPGVKRRQPGQGRGRDELLSGLTVLEDLEALAPAFQYSMLAAVLAAYLKQAPFAQGHHGLARVDGTELGEPLVPVPMWPLMPASR